MDRFFNNISASAVGLAHDACGVAQAVIEQTPSVVVGLAHKVKSAVEKTPGAVAGLAHSTHQNTQAFTSHTHEAMGTIAQNFTRIAYLAKNLPYSELGSQFAQWVKEHRAQTAFIVAGGIILVAPGLITWPLLNLLGFSAGGVAAGSIAASIQSVLGPIATGSLFAVLQSAGAGGLGLALVNLVVQVGAGALIGGVGLKGLFDAVFNANLVAGTKRLCAMEHRMIAGQTAEGSHSGDYELGWTEDHEEEERDAIRGS